MGVAPMTKLSDTQLVILSAAAQRDDLSALPLPANLRGGAAKKVIGALLAKGFLEEVEGNLRDGERVWRETGDGHAVTLLITEAGLAAIGVERESASDAPVGAEETPSARAPQAAPPEADPVPKARTPRQGTKQAKLIEMLRADDGATIDEIAAVTGWQPHTIRGAMSGALKKKLGLEVTSEKVDGRGRVYSLPPA